MKKIAILQSSYIPWKGYFDLINSVDVFVIYDDAQYTRRDWRNRNKIKTSQGVKWLTIPVEVKGKYHQKINETRIADKSWGKSHWRKIKHNYSNARFFKDFRDIVEELYLEQSSEYLSEINYKFIKAINDILTIQTALKWSHDFKYGGGKTDKLLDICKACEASEYISGPAARGYLDEKKLNDAGIKVSWMSYDGYKEYEQLYPPFEHGVTVLDLIFNVGKQANKFMNSFGDKV